jgi:hypothetical protein
VALAHPEGTISSSLVGRTGPDNPFKDLVEPRAGQPA